MKQQFITALEQNNRELIRQIPKGDLHNHITRGGNKRYISAWCDTAIPECPTFKDLGEMNCWNTRYIKPLLPGRIGYEKRIEAAFVQAKTDGVQLLHMSVTMGEEEWFDGSIATLIQTIQDIHQRVAPEIHFVPELAFLTHTPIQETIERLEQYLEYNYFRSLDIFGDESAVPGFKQAFRIAKAKGLILKAHVGEFGTSDLVKKAVEELELDQVQHGIAAAQSPETMKWLADHHIQLNICPTSNILLSRVADYGSHTIRKLYDYGVTVTVNTDDMIIFDQSVSDEFVNLYRAGLFSVEELNTIRENALTDANRK
ncbi:adenosine deaminase [Paenibacillus sp. FSL R7-277]|uniref:adenosine deaminase n=1 Tax=Paenibacillus sp. FSL R7-277 TaxID=1227352 RepID=UPI0003E2AD0B|nr:adenosine deaminase [Paenibacillus sp. FSL R7-277]ETT63053.1 adenosine deaminase [Paenibacillus sp. FSL R7-277]